MTDLWLDVLHSPTYVVAPMVNYSDLPFRMMLRAEGAADLCYTQMYHSRLFVEDRKYRIDAFKSAEGDRPLIMQFCANDPDTFRKAVLLAKGHCDAVDLNLGCPQGIARSGHYGAYLQDEWELIRDILRSANSHMPITAKIRVFPSIEKTVAYAQMLESTGISALTVHGRTIEQKGQQTGLASWKHVAAVKRALSIPVISNGNIQSLDDVKDCLGRTNCDAVMCAEGAIYNPAVFTGRSLTVWNAGLRYLDYVERYDPSSHLPDYVRGHIHKFCHPVLSHFIDMREKIQACRSAQDIRSCLNELRDRCTDGQFKDLYCRPYYRPDSIIKRTTSLRCSSNEECNFDNDPLMLTSLFGEETRA